MNTTLSNGLTREEMEVRRLEAARALLQGATQSKVARQFGVSRTTASRWSHALRQSGPDSLRRRRATGRPSRLSSEQLRAIPRLIAEGAAAFGFPNDRWTTGRLARVIESQFGVRYDPDHVGRLMYKLGIRRRAVPAGTIAPPAYALSRYSPKTPLSVSEISPTVA
ncbi:MAG: transposase [Bryobacterales bacterium]|nr:transposase [Bryobacterales bacterium]